MGIVGYLVAMAKSFSSIVHEKILELEDHNIITMVLQTKQKYRVENKVINEIVIVLMFG